VIQDNTQQAIRTANLVITSLKKRKVLRASFEDTVIAAMRKGRKTNQEKRVMRQQKKITTFCPDCDLFVLMVLTRSITLCSE
jgi:hypothetical protein